MVHFSKSLLFVTAVALATPAFASNDRVLHLSNNASLTTIDPHSTNNLDDFMIHRQIFEGLVHQNELTGEIVPRIATSYTVSPDGKKYTFTIRPGIKFHNGETLTVKDCVFSVKRALSKPQMKTRLVGVDDVYSPDENTVVITMSKPNAALITNLVDIRILNQKEVEAQGDKFGTILTLAGTGPYYLTSLQHDVEWTCNAFPEYYLGEAPIKKIHYRPIKQQASGLIAFESGELDWFVAPVANWDDLKDNKDYNTELVVANNICYFVINPLRAPLNNENLRKAIAYAIDKEAMNDVCFDGLAKVADFMIPPQNIGAPTEGITYNYDPEKAKEYLVKAGYPNGVDIGSVTCNPSGYFEKMAQVLQENLAAVGIKISINRLDPATKLNNGRKQLFDVMTAGLAHRGDFDGWRNHSYTLAKGSYYVKYDETPYDWKHMNSLWEKGAAATTPEERKVIYRELNDWIMNAATTLPVFYRVQPTVWTKDLVIPHNYPNYPVIYEWSWKK